MDEFPIYDEDGEEDLSFQDRWRSIDPQEVTGVDCFTMDAQVNELENLITLRLTGDEFREMLSSLYNGAEQTFPDRFMQIVVNFLRGLHCPPEVQEDECVDYPAFANFIGYSPMNPFSNPSEVPDGYLIPPFLALDADNIDDYGLYQIDDVIVPIDSITLDLDWFETLDGQLPTITLDVVGSGTVLIKLLSIASGGLAIITLDNPPNLADVILGILTGAENIVDLNQDIVSVPPETAIEMDFPLEITTAGDHTIYVVFLPILDDSLTPLRFGGGFRGVNLCDFSEIPTMSCEDIEDCLETSETITNIEGDITNITNSITNIEGDITNIEDCGCGGNVYPDKPQDYSGEEFGEEISTVCQEAWAIAQGLRENAIVTLNATVESSFDVFFFESLSGGGFTAQALKLLWDAWVANENEELSDDLTDWMENIAEAFFCNLLDRDAARSAIEADSELPADVKSMYLASLDSLADSKLELFRASYPYIYGTGNDCSNMCSWVIVWDFSGTYEAAEDEDAIILGNTWTVSEGEYVEGIGYRGIEDVWTLVHELPPDCRLSAIKVNCSKNELCSQMKLSTTWRDTDCSIEETQGFDATITSDTPVTMDFNPFHCEFTQMTLRADHAFCGGENFGNKIHWVRLEGTGARPSA